MYSIQTAVSDGSLTMLPLSIEYDSRDLIHVYFDGVEDARQWAWVGATDKAISFSPAVADGVVVRVQRITALDTVPNIFGAASPPYVGNAEFDADTIDQNFRQTLQVAQESTDRTDEAINRADEAVGIAESAVDTADQALADISVAVGTANQAVSTANTALNVAQGIDAKAQEALDTVNYAEGVALGIDAKAQSALDNSNAAVLAAAGATSTANDAKDIAEGIDAKAQTALDNSYMSLSIANDAKDIAEGIDVKAQDALDTANAAEQTAQDAVDLVAEAYQKASSDHWGPTEPEETFPGMTWADTSSGLLKRRNAADTAWVVEGQLYKEAAIVDDLVWLSKAIGEPFALLDNLAGVSAPDNTGAAKYIKLTAADAYNTGLLTNETVTGSAPLVQATAEIAAGPLAGQVVHLINTEESFLRARATSGVLQFDQMQKITGTLYGSQEFLSGTGAFSEGSENPGARPSNSTATCRGLNFNTSGSPGARVSATTSGETRSKNVSATFYMRIQ